MVVAHGNNGGLFNIKNLHGEGADTGPFVAIVDDLDSNRIFMEKLTLLVPEIGRVATFSSAQDALEAFRETPPDLVITDFTMPGMNADGFLAEFRRVEILEDIPVIVVSSHSKAENRYQALQAGATDFLMVPFDTFEFQVRIRNLLRLSLHQKILRSQSITLRSKLLETRQKSKQICKATEQRFISIIDCVPALVFAVNMSGECMFANQYCYDFLGLTSEATPSSVQVLADKVSESGFNFGVQIQPGASAEITLLSADQCEHVFLLAPHSIEGDSPEEIATVFSGIEISELKLTEQSLRKAKDEAEIANRAKSSFLANMSHEIRTPLNAIIGFTDIITSELFGPMQNERYKDYVLDVQNSAKHLLNIVNDILDLSNIEAHRQTINISEFSLMECLGNVLSIMDTQIRARKNIVSMPDVPNILLETDCQKFSQVLINILSNANKFTDGGIINISGVQESSGNFMLAIEDSGCGMDEEELALAIKDFGRVSKSEFISDGNSGAGLGLPISIGFMRLMGGRLDIESRKGKGTRVCITLPENAVAGPAQISAPGRDVEEHTPNLDVKESVIRLVNEGGS
ncbi:MAG: ATP-binding protein [Alphaproteobacteria bacterium]